MSDKPQVAAVEEWDSDESCAVPATLVQAKQQQARADHRQRHQQQQQQQQQQVTSQTKAGERRRTAIASDSGYSSTAKAKAVVVNTGPILTSQGDPQQQACPTKSNTNRPVLVQRADSARITRSNTVSTATPRREAAPTSKCADRNCVDPNCVSSRTTERRYTVASQRQPAPQQQQPQYTTNARYAYKPDMLPPQRPRANSASRARPQSWYAGVHPSYSSAQPGPPPSSSAYYRQYPQPQIPVYGTTPPQQISAYMPPSPTIAVPASPVSPGMPVYPGTHSQTSAYSARRVNPNIPGLEALKTATPSARHSMSARTPASTSRALPGSYPGDSGTESSSESDSENDYPDDVQYRRERARRQLEGASRSRSRGKGPTYTMVYQARPGLPKSYHTEPGLLYRRNSRKEPRAEELRRAPHSDGPEYLSSSDNFDSDRTARAVVDARRSAQSSRHTSRRPSVSTNASSQSTKATTLSSETDFSRAIIEDPRGRRVVYLSKEAQADLIRRYEQQKLDSYEEQRLAERRAAAYQKEMSGGYDEDTELLTADNVKRQNRKSQSHVTPARSQKSGHSKTSSRNDGVKISVGGTVLHVYDGTQLQVMAGEDGETHLVIGGGSGNGKHAEYNGSKSSSSRTGRSRTSRREQPIREEDGYEPGM